MARKLKVLLGLLVLSVLAGVVGSAAHAAGTDAPVFGTAQMTGFDPFTLRTYAVESESATTSMEISVLLAARRPIRIPFRPTLRSPFRPDWGF